MPGRQKGGTAQDGFALRALRDHAAKVRFARRWRLPSAASARDGAGLTASRPMLLLAFGGDCLPPTNGQGGWLRVVLAARAGDLDRSNWRLGILRYHWTAGRQRSNSPRPSWVALALLGRPASVVTHPGRADSCAFSVRTDTSSTRYRHCCCGRVAGRPSGRAQFRPDAEPVWNWRDRCRSCPPVGASVPLPLHRRAARSSRGRRHPDHGERACGGPAHRLRWAAQE